MLDRVENAPRQLLDVKINLHLQLTSLYNDLQTERLPHILTTPLMMHLACLHTCYYVLGIFSPHPARSITYVLKPSNYFTVEPKLVRVTH